MEYHLGKAIGAVLAPLGKPRNRRDKDYTDHDILRIYSWAVIHDRTQEWACQAKHGPIHLRRPPLPVPETLSRRLKTRKGVALRDALECRGVAPPKPELYWMIDGKPLVIGGCSSDRPARYGRAANSKAKGDKIHAIVAPSGAIARWRLAPMNQDERVMAERRLRTAPIQGYLAADSNYDSNKLHAVC